jgi:hypothetical protein
MYWSIVLSSFCEQAGADCTSQTLAANADCIACGITPGMELAILIYIFSVIAGASSDPQSLMSAASCLLCGIPAGLLLPVLISLVCVFFSDTPIAPDAPLSLTIDLSSTNGNTILVWTQGSAPTTNEVWRSINGAAFTLFSTVAGGATTITDPAVMADDDEYCYEVRACSGPCSAFTTPACALNNYIKIADAVLLSASFPNVVIGYTTFQIANCPNLTVVNLPRMLKCGGTISITGNATLAGTINFPVLSAVVTSFFCKNNINTAVNIASVSSIGGVLDFNPSPNLTTITATNLQTVGGFIDASACPALLAWSTPALTSVASDFVFSNDTAMVSFNSPVLSSVGGSLVFLNNTSLTSATLTSLATVAGEIDFINTALTTISLPALTAVNGGGGFMITNNLLLTTLSVPLLVTIAVNLSINDTALTTISMPALTSVGTELFLFSNAALTSISLPALISPGSPGDFDAGNCPNLSSVSFPNIIFPDNGQSVNIAGAALDGASVNHILARLVASGVTSLSINIGGGTSAAPSGQGIIDKGILIVAGNSVTTN